MSRLGRAGVDPGPEAIEVVEDELCEAEIPAVRLTGERWAWGPGLLLGRIFTHRLSAEEIEHDLLHVNPDLSALLALDRAPQRHRYGRAAMQALIERASATGRAGVALSYQPANTRARTLYASLGFVETGETDGDDVIARLHPAQG